MENNNNNRFKQAFNLKANFRDIYTQEDSRILFMDGMRCLGMFYVVLGHSIMAFLFHYQPEMKGFVQDMPWYLQWMVMGDRAVDTFFVISGFLIGQMLFKEYNRTQTINLKRFFNRRFMRLAPAYYILIIVYAITAGPEIEKAYLWTFVFYINNFFDVDYNYIHYAWSLAIEEQFYAVFSIFVAYFFYKINRQLGFLCFLFILSFAIRAVLLLMNPEIIVSGDYLISGRTPVSDTFWEVIYDNLHTRYGAIVLGIILAYLYVYKKDDVAQWATDKRCNWLFAWAMFLYVLVSVLPVYEGEASPDWLVFIYQVSHRNLFSLAVAFTMVICLENKGIGRVVNSFLSSRIFYPISQLTYSMYLLHLPCVGASYMLFRSLGIVDGLNYSSIFIVFIGAFIPTMMLSSIMYVFVEKPFMKLRR